MILLVVGDPEAVSTIAVETERLLRQHSVQIDGVHVGDQHNLLRPRPDKARMNHPADLFRRVDHPIGVARIWFDELDLAAERFQPVGNQR